MTHNADNFMPQDTETKSFHFTRHHDIGVITIDVPNERMNTLKASFVEEVNTLLDSILQDKQIKGLVICSGKPDSFIVGADIHMLGACESAEHAQALAVAGQEVFNRLASLKIPRVAAIHGPCLGGGLELALACSARICSDDERTRLGLPETQLGLIPGSGGTQRLPKVVGIARALDMMLTGKQLRAKQARKAGLVKEVVAHSILLDTAIKLARKKSRKPKRDWQEWWLSGNPLGRKLVFEKAHTKVLKKTQGHYPAQEQLLQVVRVGLEQGIKAGLLAEAQAFGDLVMSHESQALRHLFLATTDMKKETQWQGGQPQPIHRVGVLGGGLMGGGIAFVTATKAALPVRIKDVAHHGIKQAMASAYRLLARKVRRRHLTRPQMQHQLNRITGTLNYSGFERVEVVVEAVFEDIELKQQMVADTELHCLEHTIFATNTSSLPIHQIANEAKRPEQIVGLHYFSPVPKMPLVEVIPHATTAPNTVATVLSLARAQGKTPIVVQDTAGFYVNRILAPYLNEAARVLLEGEPIEAIDRALVSYGFPVGPLSLLDEVGLDVAVKIAPVLEQELGERFKAPDAFATLLDKGRKGKKNGRGFYRYRDEKAKLAKKRVDDSLYKQLGIKPHARLPAQEIAERCMLLMLNEAAQALDEGVVASARDGDIGAVFGIGFPPYMGGPFNYMDQVGLPQIVDKMREYAHKYGARFAPCAALCQMAEQEQSYYS